VKKIRNQLYPTSQFFQRREPLNIKRSYIFEDIDCSFSAPTTTAGEINQSIKLAITTEFWPIRMTVKSNFGQESVCDIFIDDEVMLALTEAYLRLRDHYESSDDLD